MPFGVKCPASLKWVRSTEKERNVDFLFVRQLTSCLAIDPNLISTWKIFWYTSNKEELELRNVSMVGVMVGMVRQIGVKLEFQNEVG